MTAPVCAQSVKAGIEAWQKADYSAAVAIWRPLAERGDTDAEFNLGQAYRLGRGVPINLAAAKSWFAKAAGSGHVDAETTLGLLLFQNGDQMEGLKWLKRAADQDEPRAMLVYGTALYNGDGVAQDRTLGYAYVSRAATAGLGPAKDTLQQLDELMPVADRQKALLLARAGTKPPAPAARATEKPARDARANAAAANPPGSKRVMPKAEPMPSSRSSSTAAASGAWRIQLGAFAQRGGAEALYQRVSSKPALAGRRPFYITAGGVTRLQIGPFASKAGAASACGSIGTACFPVAAK